MKKFSRGGGGCAPSRPAPLDPPLACAHASVQSVSIRFSHIELSFNLPVANVFYVDTTCFRGNEEIMEVFAMLWMICFPVLTYVDKMATSMTIKLKTTRCMCAFSREGERREREREHARIINDETRVWIKWRPKQKRRMNYAHLILPSCFALNPSSYITPPLSIRDRTNTSPFTSINIGGSDRSYIRERMATLHVSIIVS